MLLIIYDKSDFSTVMFMNLLRFKKCDFVSIEAVNIGKVKITDKGSDSCIWQLENGFLLNFSYLKSIYLRSVNFYNKEIFSNFTDKDNRYANRELSSYIFYRLYNSNCINRFSLDLISMRIFEVPYFFSIALKSGFIIPDYLFSNDYEAIKEKFHSKGKNYVAHNSFFANTRFIPSENISKTTIGLVEIIKGDVIIAHVVGDQVYATSVVENKKFKISIEENLKEKILKLAHNLGLVSMQVVLIDGVLYNVSPYPNFSLSSTDQRDQIFSSLCNILKID